MSLVAVSDIKVGTGKKGETKIIRAGEPVNTSSGLERDQVKELVAAGAVTDASTATAEAAEAALKERKALEDRALEAEATAVREAEARQELEAELRELKAQHERDLNEAITAAVKDAQNKGEDEDEEPTPPTPQQ